MALHVMWRVQGRVTRVLYSRLATSLRSLAIILLHNYTYNPSSPWLKPYTLNCHTYAYVAERRRTCLYTVLALPRMSSLNPCPQPDGMGYTLSTQTSHYSQQTQPRVTTTPNHAVGNLQIPEGTVPYQHSSVWSRYLSVDKFCRHPLVNSQSATYLSAKGGRKLRFPIWNNSYQNTMEGYNFLQKQPSQPHSIYCRMTLDKMPHHRKPIHHYPHGMKLFAFQQRRHKINRNIFSWFLRHWQRSKHSKYYSPPRPGPLAMMAIPYILIHLLQHILPEILSIQLVKCLRPSCMSGMCGIMMLLYQL